MLPVSAFLTEKETKDEKIYNLISGKMLVVGLPIQNNIPELIFFRNDIPELIFQNILKNEDS